MPRDYFINEGVNIGGQEPQGLGTAQARIKASATVVKGNLLEVSGNWTVAPASDKSAKVVGVAFSDAASGAAVTVRASGFMKFDASGAITAGDKLVAAAAGKVRKKAVSGDEAATVVGIALNDCADAGLVYAKLVLSAQ